MPAWRFATDSFAATIFQAIAWCNDLFLIASGPAASASGAMVPCEPSCLIRGVGYDADAQRDGAASRRWGVRLARRNGFIAASTAIARKLEEIMHRIWVDESASDPRPAQNPCLDRQTPALSFHSQEEWRPFPGTFDFRPRCLTCASS